MHILDSTLYITIYEPSAAKVGFVLNPYTKMLLVCDTSD